MKKLRVLSIGFLIISIILIAIELTLGIKIFDKENVITILACFLLFGYVFSDKKIRKDSLITRIIISSAVNYTFINNYYNFERSLSNLYNIEAIIVVVLFYLLFLNVSPISRM